MHPLSAELLPEYPVVIELPVQWGDQDALRHVNNVVYFRWMESARIAYWEQVGVVERSPQNPVGPILAAVNCNYRRQVIFPDTVLIGSKVSRIGNSSMNMQYAVASVSQRAVVAEGDSTIVVFDYDAGQSVRVPDPIRSSIEQLEGRSVQ